MRRARTDTPISLIELIMDLRSRGISDTHILAAIEKVPREDFVETAFSHDAYANRALPIECGQTISQPFVVAYMLMALEVNDRHKVLEVGLGSGYQTAILSHLCRRVYAIERYRTLARLAEARLAALRITNVTVLVGDGMKGWQPQAPFDRIIVSACADETPTALIEQLAVGGIMVIPVGTSGGDQHIFKVRKTETGIEEMKLIPVRFVPLVPGTAKQL